MHAPAVLGGSVVDEKPRRNVEERVIEIVCENLGVNKANPLPLLLPAIDLLAAVGQMEIAKRLWNAVETVLSAGTPRTPDLGGDGTTTAMADAIAAHL